MSFFTKIKDPPQFTVGEEVEFELNCETPTALPRWDHEGRDRGGSGEWTKGTVHSVTEYYIYVKYTADGYFGSGIANFPYIENENYSLWQWERRGFLRKVCKIRCECGSQSVYFYDCLHSTWCPQYKKYK